MSGDCGHGWGYHFLGSSFPCFACKGYWSRESALMALLKLEGEVADLKARLKAAGKLLVEHDREEAESAKRALNLRNKNWRKP